jgi:vitamin B12 transporter
MNRPFFAAAIAAIASVPTFADELPPVIVSATRTAQAADEALASVSVITREAIERHRTRDVAEMLRLEAGIAISRNGGYGKSTSVFLRGTDASHVLVLVDGVRAASATTGEFAWQNLAPEQIERIEIVRGPRASLYGSDAIGGVVHIFTRRDASPHARVAAGSHGTYEVSGGIGGGERWRYRVDGGHTYSAGIPTNDVFDEDHGYTNTHATIGVDGPLGDDTTLAFSATQAEGSSEQDPQTGDSDFLNRVVSLRLDHRAGAWEQSLTAGHALDEYTIHSPTSPATITTRRSSLSWQHDLLRETGVTSLGIDHWQDAAEKDRSGTIDETLRNTGVFLQQQLWLGDHDLQLALRGDDHETAGNHATWNAAWGTELPGAVRLIASYGTAFKSPTVNDLYWPRWADTFFGTTYVTEGNPDLEPEESASAEVGLRHRSGPVEVKVTAFRTWTDNLIDWASSQTGPAEYTYRPVNVNRARIEGFEVGMRWPMGGWTADVQATLLDARNADTGDRLDRRPSGQLAAVLQRPTAAGDLTLEWLAVSDRVDRGGSVTLPGYGLINVAWRHRLQPALTADLRIENLFDQDYTLASSFSGDYNTLGRSAYLGLTWRPE